MEIHRLARAAFCAALAAPLAALAVVDAQIDNFESGTTANWSAGLPHPAPPENVPTGGPAGTDDNYLELESVGGAGPGSRLAAFDAAQWAGDYGTAQIGAILMDVKNFGASDLSLRLLFADSPGAGFANAGISTTAVVVPAGSGWVTVLFPITPSDLTALAGTTTQALSNTVQLWILHNGTAAFPPPAVAAVLGVDNIEALPEPSAAAGLGAGLALLAGLGRARANRR